MSKSNAASGERVELTTVEPPRLVGEPSFWVRQDRRLAEAYFTITIQEMRLIWELASRSRLADDAFTEHEFTLSELREIFGEHLSFAGAEESLMRLYRRELHLEPNATVTESLRWVISAIRDREKETFRVALHPKLKTYFLGLKKWVQSEKATLFSFSSEYAARIYMWACVFRNQEVQTWEISIADLRARLGIPSTQYQRFSNLRARVLDGPVQEVNRVAAPFQLSIRIRKRSYTPVAVVFSLDTWSKTTTGTGGKVKKKIAGARRKKAAAASASKPVTIEQTPEQVAVKCMEANQAFTKIKEKVAGPGQHDQTRRALSERPVPSPEEVAFRADVRRKDAARRQGVTVKEPELF